MPHKARKTAPRIFVDFAQATGLNTKSGKAKILTKKLRFFHALQER